MHAGAQLLAGSTISLWTSGVSAAQLGSSATTAADGSFSLNFTCPSAGTLIYATASGGHVGSGAANSHIQLTSALGACGSLPPSVVINEFTSVASAYALNGFAVPATGTATWSFQGKSPGLDQAFNTLTNLTITSTGAFETTGPETNATQVQQTMNTLANALAACDASSTGACTELFTCASPNATFVATGQACTVSGSPVLATDTLGAAIAVAQNAGTIALQGIFDVGTTGTPPFTPVLAASPNDWTLPLIFAFKNFGPLALDAGGHAWVLTSDPNPPAAPAVPSLVVAELDANFNVLSPGPHYFNGGGLAAFDNTDLSNLAIDGSGNVWIGGGPSATRIAELTALGASAPGAGTSGYAAGGGPGGTAGVTIDSAGNAWFASGNQSLVLELGPTGTLLSGSSGFSASNCPCNNIAADALGNVWTIGSNQFEYLAEMNAGGTQGAIVHPPGYAGATFYSIAIDGSGNLWLGDQHDGGIWQYSPTSTTFSPTSGGPYPNIAARNNPSHPVGIAIDGAGHKWVANRSTQSSGTPASSITEFTADGSANLSPIDGFGSGSIASAYSVAIDGSGNVWVADGGNTIIQFVGAGSPTKNPIVSAVDSGSFSP